MTTTDKDPMHPTKTTQRDPMTSNIVHLLLVNTNRLQAVPAPVVAGVLLLIGAGVYAVGGGFYAGLYLLTAFADWLVLWLLPRFERSYGPDRPSALALALVRGVLLGVLSILPAGVAVGAAVVAAFSLTAVVIYSTWVEPFRLGVTMERYTCRGWRPGLAPVRLLHIGDIHVERITARERRLNALITELKPDVIVFSGDFVNISYADDPQTEADIRKIISQWDAPLGVYCVPGTYTVEAIERVRQFVAGVGNLRLLEDEWVTMDTPAGKLNILGMVTTHHLAQDQHKVQALHQNLPGLKLLLTHAPDAAPEADAAGYDLYLCGHTHGGQLRLPIIGAVFSGSALGMRFVMGRYDLDQVTVYTSRGVGLEGMGAPRARFLCPPEVILWEISG